MPFRNPAAVAVTPNGGSITELSDHSRSPINEDREERSVSVELADGTLKKYIKSIKHKWSFDWQWLPDQNSDTADGYAGRETLHGMFATATSGDTFTLTVRDRAASGGTLTRTYTVYVDAYSDDLIKRDTALSKYFFNVKLVLKEK